MPLIVAPTTDKSDSYAETPLAPATGTPTGRVTRGFERTLRPTDTVGAAALDWRAGDGARDASAAFRPQDRDPHNMSDNQSTTAGVNAKFFSSELSDDDKFTGFGADVQAQAVFGDFRAALGVANVGSSMKSASGEKFSVPSSILAAGDWRGEFGKNGIEAMVDLNYYFSGSFTAAAGVQYDFRDMVFVRAGYHYGAKDAFLPSFATVGAGVKFFGVSVNAAYLLGNDVLKNTLTVGLGYSF